jgi:hypothetical protein
MSSRSAIVRSVIGSAIIALLVFVALVAYAPDATPFSPNNYGWNGIHDIASSYPLSFTNSLGNLKTQPRAVLVIMQPVYPFSQTDANNVRNFALGGGTVVIADSTGESNSLIQNAGIGITIQGNYTILDDTYNWKGPTLPSILVFPAAQTGFLSGVKGIGTDEPSPLAIQSGSSAQEVAISSPLSYETNRSSVTLALPLITGAPKALAKGSFVVAALQRVGNGTVFVVGDSQFFTNSMWNVADNSVLMGNLFSGSTVYVDTSHWQTNTVAGIKADVSLVYSQMSQFPLRYLFALVFVGAAIGILPVFSSMSSAASRRSIKREAPQTTYNAAILDRVRKDRERHGVQAE